MIATRHARPAEMETYERVRTDAMAGDLTLFAPKDCVEQAWRTVDPALEATTPVLVYEPHTSGPEEIDPRLIPRVGSLRDSVRYVPS